MNIDQFWDLIERARTAAGPSADLAIRDFDNPDDDPNRDYWDFGDLDLDPELLAAVMKGDPEALAAVEAELAAKESEDDDEDDEDDEDDDQHDHGDGELVDPVAHALIELLTRLSAEEIAGFEQNFAELRDKAARDDIANAAVLIEHGFLGDDSFEDFRAGLVALGRTAYEKALANPDSLAEHPMVREIAQANDPRWLGREDLLYAAGHAYSTVTGEDEITFIDFVESQFPDAAVDEDDDDVVDWEVTDESATRQRLPRLADLFFERSMRNRARAMDKLGLRD